MLPRDLEEALNDQINKEVYSSYLYLQMAAHFDASSLPGCSSWMRLQAAEEYAHAMRFYDHLLQRDGVVRLAAIAAPPTSFGSPLEVFEQVLEHEQQVTASIAALFGPADQATVPLLQWFATEQVEEEQTVRQIIDSLRLAGQDGPALLLIDRELGSRGAAPATPPV